MCRHPICSSPLRSTLFRSRFTSRVFGAIFGNGVDWGLAFPVSFPPPTPPNLKNNFGKDMMKFATWGSEMKWVLDWQFRSVGVGNFYARSVLAMQYDSLLGADQWLDFTSDGGCCFNLIILEISFFYSWLSLEHRYTSDISRCNVPSYFWIFFVFLYFERLYIFQDLNLEQTLPSIRKRDMPGAGIDPTTFRLRSQSTAIELSMLVRGTGVNLLTHDAITLLVSNYLIWA